MVQPARTSVAFENALREILEERNLSIRALARMVGVGPDHLSRVLTGSRGKRPTPDLIERVTDALGLPAGYFPEARLATIVRVLERDLQLLDATYDRLMGDVP